ncbi:histidine phosphatase family protein [Nocardioides gilvus]|uniref:histidine phosphatase family protein n=1 Tax=Nocardioides gilvus TaxID=1735589 RepID=UPI000D74320C|nr:histidine phosphatase family protein [Nocardioides gilvus]
MGQILLVRHGQASFGTDDYDVLSALGEEQAGLLGRELAGLSPDVVVHGELRRQRETAVIAAGAAGWTAPVRVDPRWDEFELAGSAARMASREEGSRKAFQRWYEGATDRWLAGEHEPGDEPWVDFCARTSAALVDLSTVGTAVVFTSGGPIAALAAALLDGGAASYRRLMPVMVNTSVTRVVMGRRGTSLISFNGHEHLSRDLVTYR